MTLSITAPSRALLDCLGKVGSSLFAAERDDQGRPLSCDEMDLDRQAIHDLLAVNPDVIQCHSDLAVLMSCYRARY